MLFISLAMIALVVVFSCYFVWEDIMLKKKQETDPWFTTGPKGRSYLE